MPSAVNKDMNTFLREKEHLQDAGRLRWYHWAIIAASFLLTLLAWSYARAQNEAQNQARFDRQAELVVDLISERMLRYEDALWNGAAAIGSQTYGMTSQEWRTYTQALNIETKYPGINGIGIIYRVEPDGYDAFLEEQRKDRPNFNIHPKHEESEYWPITYIEPTETNAEAVGLDMAHEYNRFTAAKKARDIGEPQITGPIILVQDAKKTAGFLFYEPFYKPGLKATVRQRQDSFLGLVYAPFIFERLMNGTLGTENRLVGLKITDGQDILFDETNGSQTQNHMEAKYQKEVTAYMYGRDWTYNIWSVPAFEQTAVNNTPTVILITGLLIDALLVSIFALLARSSRSAIKLAENIAEEQEAEAIRYENIMDRAADGIWTSDIRGKIISVNKAAEAMFGYPADELVGQTNTVLMPKVSEKFAGVVSKETGEADPELVKILISQSHEVTGRRKDGSEIDLEISISEMTDRGKIIYNTIGRDITWRKKTEEDLRLTMEDLILSNEDLEKFAYIASHDLKSPLRAIDNLSKWLEEDLDAIIDEENRDRIHKLRGRVARMENLLNALLQYSRAGTTAKDLTKITAGQLIRDIAGLLNVPEGFTVEAAPEMDDIEISRMPMEQVFHNLISNAIKHHDKPTGTIRVSGKSKGKNFIFRIKDDGPGIDAKFHEKIFEMFQTLRPRDEVEGSGMGLALVKKIVYHHGGRIDIESQDGQGSEFIVLWPKAPRVRSRPSRQKDIANA